MLRIVLAAVVCLLAVARCGGTASSGPTGTLGLASLVAPGGTPIAGHPVARLATGGGLAVDGVLGSWTLDETSSDSSWIAASELEAATLSADDLILIGWADGTPIGAWSAKIADAADATGASATDAGSGDVSGADYVTFGRVAAGEWVLAVTLHRADGRGEATYYWSLKVT